MQRPKNLLQMHGFLVAVNHSRFMWPQCAHILAPLSREPGKKMFHWTPEMDLAFQHMKALMLWNCLLAYPDHNKPFHIYTDASSYEMGACIVQDDKPVALWSCKRNDAQTKYTVSVKEFLSIVIVLTDFCTILLWAVLHIHTDHLNITTNNKFQFQLSHNIWPITPHLMTGQCVLFSHVKINITSKKHETWCGKRTIKKKLKWHFSWN